MHSHSSSQETPDIAPYTAPNPVRREDIRGEHEPRLRQRPIRRFGPGLRRNGQATLGREKPWIRLSTPERNIGVVRIFTGNCASRFSRNLPGTRDKLTEEDITYIRELFQDTPSLVPEFEDDEIRRIFQVAQDKNTRFLTFFQDYPELKAAGVLGPSVPKQFLDHFRRPRNVIERLFRENKDAVIRMLQVVGPRNLDMWILKKGVPRTIPEALVWAEYQRADSRVQIAIDSGRTPKWYRNRTHWERLEAWPPERSSTNDVSGERSHDRAQESRRLSRGSDHQRPAPAEDPGISSKALQKEDQASQVASDPATTTGVGDDQPSSRNLFSGLVYQITRAFSRRNTSVDKKERHGRPTDTSSIEAEAKTPSSESVQKDIVSDEANEQTAPAEEKSNAMNSVPVKSTKATAPEPMAHREETSQAKAGAETLEPSVSNEIAKSKAPASKDDAQQHLIETSKVLQRNDPDGPNAVGRKKALSPSTEIAELKARGKGINKATSRVSTLRADQLRLTPLEIGQAPVPNLAHDLQRVLFNSGVYQLQDPRSKVYNFDPYLQNIVPVSDFNFKALKDYIVSSKDTVLSQIAKDQKKKYYGSSSSMTSVLVHFHFLLSHWRPFNMSSISQGFSDPLSSATLVSKSPTAVFLRYKDGAYAIDADKEYDTANVLLELGKSLEKFLTLPPEEYERYKKGHEVGISEEERNEPESYHYTTLDDFLMRSQLDAHDPRLPGTGMFDLKTRAVVSIRMNPRDYESGTGYQINGRFGDWESYEREYFDMVRSAFLKYSMQVRMGRMDGIFVAYHNVEQIFGFQYFSKSEMDLAIHGQSDAVLGDQEFTLSLKLWNELLDRATEKFPGQSLRLHFETRDATVPFMYVFAEPVTEEEIQEIQDKNKADIEEYTRKLHNAEQGAPLGEELSAALSKTSRASTEKQTNRFQDFVAESGLVGDETLTRMMDTVPQKREVLGFTLVVRHVVNGMFVERPNNLSADDHWTIEYNLTDMKEGQTRSLYDACKTRRHKAMTNERALDDPWANVYLRNIQKLVRKGREKRAAELKESERSGSPKLLYPDIVHKTNQASTETMEQAAKPAGGTETHMSHQPGFVPTPDSAASQTSNSISV